MNYASTIAVAAEELGVTVSPVTEQRPLERGELYLAIRNNRVRLQSCLRHDLKLGQVFSEQGMHSYETQECWRIECDANRARMLAFSTGYVQLTPPPAPIKFMRSAFFPT